MFNRIVLNSMAIFVLAAFWVSIASVPSFLVSELRAQSASFPQTYSVTEINSMAVAGMTMKIYRDGSQAMIDLTYPPNAGNAAGNHIRTLYDLKAQRSYSLDLTNTAAPCGSATYSGDWGDPFAGSSEMTADLAKQNPKQLGKETINGIATKALELVDPKGKGKARIWLDEKYGLIVKWEMVPENGQAQTMLEVKQLSLDKPPASLFVLPAACAQAAAAPTPPTESQLVAAETGGNAEDFAKAIMPPPSKNSCSVLFRVVHAGTMEPITSGFQVGLDTSTDPDPGGYNMAVGTDGHVRFSGGGIREVTGQFRNGILRINNPPPHFDMDVEFGNGGSSSALIYRQCFSPETILLLVVKNPQVLSQGADYLWVKSGKLATVK